MSKLKLTDFAPILVVEDEEDHIRLIKKSLRDVGHVLNKIYTTKNGQEALDFLNKVGDFKDSTHQTPILILLDVKMPLKNGFEVLHEIKKNKNLKHIPVVMLTTTSTSEDIKSAMDLGANDYIVKPVNFKNFTEKVAKLGHYWGLVSDAKRII
jgi:two-component system, response regulator